MSERTRTAIVSEFCALARASKPNCQSSLDAQNFFKEHVMGLDSDLLDQRTGKRTADQQSQINTAYHDGIKTVLRSLTGAEFQTAAGHDTIMNMIPQQETGVRRALRKVAISYGILEPAGWGGK